VLENLTITDSIKRGWKITRKNLGFVLLNGIVLIVIGVIFGWIAAIPALVIWVPVARAVLHQNWNTGTILAAIFMAFYFLFIAVGIGGILTSFNSALWTKLYKAMNVNENISVSNSQAS
jgi:membrane-anchored glycerophosphoryl diester phosphodiesterase (GDPDase)